MAPRSRSNRTAALCAAVLTVFLSTFAVAAVNILTPEDKILSKGFQAYMDGSDKQALSYFEEVIRINPGNKAAQKGLDKVKVRLRKMADLEKARKIDLAKKKVKEGKSMQGTGDIVGAIDCYHAAQDAVEDWKSAVSSLAHIRKDMERVSERKKLNLSSWSFARGVVAYLDRDWAKAWRIWSERLTLEPTNVALANATARAEKNFKKMMVAEQEEFFRRGARAFYEQGLYAQALNSWAKVIEIRGDDQEALEGKARAEEAQLAAAGKGRNNEVHDLLEEGLEQYAQQNWRKSMAAFTRLIQVDPTFSTAKEYVAKLNKKLESPDYTPSRLNDNDNWRQARPSNQGGESVKVPTQMENMVESKKELEAQVRREPGNIKAQQELDKIAKSQEDEGERVYKDGLIAYSQGNRSLAIQNWKQVLVINPEHKKAAAALRKARAEEERTAEEGAPQ